jgi:hypothetical protein
MRPTIGPMLLQGQVQMQTVARQVATNRRVIVPKIAMELYRADNINPARQCQLHFFVLVRPTGLRACRIEGGGGQSGLRHG